MAEACSEYGQIPQPPGDADSASTIPSVVHHLAVGAAEHVRAGLQSAARIEAFNPDDQPEASLLEQIVIGLRTLLLLTFGDQVCQSEVLENPLVALPQGIGQWSALLMAPVLLVDQKENASSSSGFRESGRSHAHSGDVVGHSGACDGACFRTDPDHSGRVPAGSADRSRAPCPRP